MPVLVNLPLPEFVRFGRDGVREETYWESG